MSDLIITRADASSSWLYVNGHVVHTTCLEFITLVSEHLSFTEDCLTLDCSDLKSIDGDGFGVLTNLYVTLLSQRKVLRLHNLRGQPAEMMNALDIVNFFTGDKKCLYPSELQSV